MSERINTNILPIIKEGKADPVNSTRLLIVPVRLEDRIHARTEVHNIQVDHRNIVEAHLADKGLALTIDSNTGTLTVFNKTIPARDLHKGIRNQGHDPNNVARWLVGNGGYNQLSKEDAEGFYVNSNFPGFEVGFLTFPEGDAKNVAPSEVPHHHPGCVEYFIITSGRMRITDGIPSDGPVEKGFEITLDMENAHDNSPGVKIHKDTSGETIALSYMVRTGSYHLLTHVNPGTEMILAKRVTRKPSGTVANNWSRRELHHSVKSQ